MALVYTPARSSQTTPQTSFEDFLAVLDNLRLGRDVVIDVERREVRVNDQRIDLTPQESHLLSHLARNADRTVTRDELFETVWSNRGLDTEARTVDAHIRRLRRKLEVEDLISTVRGAGYRFNSTSGVRVLQTRRHALAA
ncbi:MAG: winged helix-turn-helix domain-containing protein [Actinomyces sp.]|nr:winged helix-turn-helix domain-containing protein [Actinomyces sp.]